MSTANEQRTSLAEPEELKQSEIEALVSEIEEALSHEVRVVISYFS